MDEEAKNDHIEKTHKFFQEKLSQYYDLPNLHIIKLQNYSNNPKEIQELNALYDHLLIDQKTLQNDYTQQLETTDYVVEDYINKNFQKLQKDGKVKVICSQTGDETVSPVGGWGKATYEQVQKACLKILQDIEFITPAHDQRLKEMAGRAEDVKLSMAAGGAAPETEIECPLEENKKSSGPQPYVSESTAQEIIPTALEEVDDLKKELLRNDNDRRSP